MKIHNNLGICILLASTVLDLYTAEPQHKKKHRFRRNQKNIQWIGFVKSSSNTREFAQGLRKRPDVLLSDQNSLTHEKKSKNKWKIFKDSIPGRNQLENGYQFVEMSRNERIDGLRSYAVRQPNEPRDHLHTGILSLAAAVMLIVVVVICIHAPCTCLWRRRHRTDLEVDLISCPNPTAHDGKCGKCLFDKVTSKKNSSKFGFSRRKFSPSPVATNEELFMSCENQPPWITDSNKAEGKPSKLPSPKKSRSIVQAILKRSRDRDKFRYEFLASRYGYNYKQFRDSYKRSSIYDEQDPNWYSAGEFLNNQSTFRGQKNYGSTDAGKSGENTCCKWARGQQKATNQSVEDIIKLQPRRRQIVELQEFPVGYSGTYASGNMNGQDNLLFDPMYDVTKPCRHSNSMYPCGSTIDMYFPRLDEESNNNSMSSNIYKKPRAPSPKSNTKSNAKIVHQFPTQFDYDPKFVQNEGESKQKKERKNDWEQDEDSDLYETSSDELLSFDEWDELQERRERRSQEFLYSPHMQTYRQFHHSYPAVLRYPDIPRDTRSLPREYKTRMRRHVARSENELRRSSGYFGQPQSHSVHYSSRGHQCHSSSDTSLHRMQIEKELAAAGLTKGKSPKKQKEAKMRIRDNRLDPLAGIMSPMRPLKDPTKHHRSHRHNADTKQRSDMKLNDLKCSLKKENYIVKLPSLESLSCKETNLYEHKDEGTLKKEPEYYKTTLEKELNNEKAESNYNRVHLDPHYIKNSYLREEPVRDTDSDDGESTSRIKNISNESQLSNKHSASQSSLNREEMFSSNRSTRL